MVDERPGLVGLSSEKFASINTLREENKKNLIRAAYRALLFREVDDSSLNHLMKVLHDKISFKTLINELKQSEEFKNRHLNIGTSRPVAQGRIKPIAMTLKAEKLYNSMRESVVARGEV
ncbi:hypothetical protein [Marinobacter metalliresistant]|uniref:Uncharacterized protein n=1 Tax=Marinobacter metalliresistant TaxID=2961995 RepID=A0ABZ2W5C6_9GAMM